MDRKTLEYKAAGFALMPGGRKGMIASDGRTFHGLLSPFGPPPDDANPPDIVEPGAYTESLKARPTIPWLWQHDHRLPVGKTVILEQFTAWGLYFKTRLTPGVQQADETLALIRDEVVVGTSIGYNAVEAMPDTWEGERIRRLKKIDLFEGSSVTFAAASRARAMPFADIDQFSDVLSICEYESYKRRNWPIPDDLRIRAWKAELRQLERAQNAGLTDRELLYKRLYLAQEARKAMRRL